MRPFGEAGRIAVAKNKAETISENAAATSLVEEVEGMVMFPCVVWWGPEAQASKPAGLAGTIAVAMHSSVSVKAATAANALFKVVVMSYFPSKFPGSFRDDTWNA